MGMLLPGLHCCSPEEGRALLLGLGSLPGFCPAPAPQDRVPIGAPLLRVHRPRPRGGRRGRAGLRAERKGRVQPRRVRFCPVSRQGAGRAGGDCRALPRGRGSRGAVREPSVLARARAQSGTSCGIAGSAQWCWSLGTGCPWGSWGTPALLAASGVSVLSCTELCQVSARPAGAPVPVPVVRMSPREAGRGCGTEHTALRAQPWRSEASCQARRAWLLLMVPLPPGILPGIFPGTSGPACSQLPAITATACPYKGTGTAPTTPASPMLVPGIRTCHTKASLWAPCSAMVRPPCCDTATQPCRGHPATWILAWPLQGCLCQPRDRDEAVPLHSLSQAVRTRHLCQNRNHLSGQVLGVMAVN
ncbi:uncharacterized protein LOC127482334 [Manacus candei]|uniref:uncharacterized protein LOC127482334 n=1 Tax=Manacus candei TaxID=415023 RepID=UPI002225E991|nr:uncharacterized protein LOC127482334 [Manacus candei]